MGGYRSEEKVVRSGGGRNVSMFSTNWGTFHSKLPKVASKTQAPTYMGRASNKGGGGGEPPIKSPQKNRPPKDLG